MLRELSVLGLIILFLSAVPAKGEVTEVSAAQAINDAEAVIREMQAMDFGVTYANDTLNEAKLLLGQKYYEASEALAKKVLDIRESAIRISGLIDTVEARIYDMSSKGYDVSEAKALFESGLAEFKLGNYEDSEKTMSDAMNRLDEIESEESLKKASAAGGIDLVLLFLDYLWLIIIILLAALITGLKAKMASEIRKCKNRIKALESEKGATENRIREAQKKYFEKGTISKMDYEIALDKHSKKLADIKKELSILKAKVH